jgi:pimeloyl-ACP methyl ester carboxylesterase
MGQSCSIDSYINERLFFPCPTDESRIYSSEKSNIKTFLINGISGVKVLPDNPKEKIDKVLIYSNSTCADIVCMGPYLEQLAENLNICCIGYDYPGYGQSGGECSEQGCYDSLEIIIDYVLNHLNMPKENIILMGASLGTGVIVDYISKHDWTALVILVCPFKSVCTIMYDTILVKPVDKFRSIDKISKAKCPVKIFHGEKDDFVNISHAKMLYDKLSNKKIKPTWIPEADHADILDYITMQELYDVIYNKVYEKEL